MISVVKRFFSIQTRMQKYFPRNKIIKYDKQKQEYPKSYPIAFKQDTNHKSIGPYIKRLYYQTNPHQVPSYMYKSPLHQSIALKGKDFQNKNTYLIESCLIGPANSGKSSLINKLVGQHISAKSSKSLTTYQLREGIYNKQHISQNQTKNLQVVLYDTPGIIKKGNIIITKEWQILNECQLALYVVDANKGFSMDVKIGAERLQKHSLTNPSLKQKVLVFTKMDLCSNARKLRQLIGQVQICAKFNKIFYVSSQTQFGLQQLKSYIQSKSNKQSHKYPKHINNILTPCQQLEQLLQQVVYERLNQQVPFMVAVELAAYAQRSDGIITMRFNIQVQRNSQKGIVLGHKGRNLKKFSQKIRVEMAKQGKSSIVFFDVVVKKSEKDSYYVQTYQPGQSYEKDRLKQMSDSIKEMQSEKLERFF